MNIEFQIHKVAQAIKTHGSSFTFARPAVNEFGEPTDGGTKIKIRGLYHTTHSFVSTSGTQGSTTRSKRSPLILALMEDGAKIQTGDTLIYQGRKYTVTEVQNVSEMNICTDISLEEVQGNGST